jgi:hypothetical protein
MEEETGEILRIVAIRAVEECRFEVELDQLDPH